MSAATKEPTMNLIQTGRARIKELFKGDHGAIMIMGTFMGIGLIGATWYVIGLGDAIIYKNKVQESADSAAFSAAAVHAKGMNFIAAINMIMLVLTALWLIINIVEDILGAILDIVGNTPGKLGPLSCMLDGNEVIGIGGTGFSFNIRRSCCTPGTTLNAIVDGAALVGVGASFCEISEVVKPIHDGVRDARERYGRALDTILPNLGRAERVVKNIVTPPGAFAAGFIAGNQYQETAIVVGASMIPAGGVGGLGGLPLETKEFGDLCEHAIKGVFSWINDNIIGNIPVVGQAFNSTPFSQIIGVIQDIISGALVSRYCDGGRGGPFDQEGFEVVKGGISNGSEQLQLWAFVPSNHDDNKAKIVPIGSRGRAAAPVASVSNTYFAQAEYFYNCAEAWDDGACNDNDNAMFNLRWQARLRRVHIPSIGTTIADQLNAGIEGAIESAADFLAPTDTAPTAGDFAANSTINLVLTGAAGPLTGGVSQVGAALDPAGFIPTLVH
jgi:hypothetical protein